MVLFFPTFRKLKLILKLWGSESLCGVRSRWCGVRRSEMWGSPSLPHETRCICNVSILLFICRPAVVPLLGCHDLHLVFKLILFSWSNSGNYSSIPSRLGFIFFWVNIFNAGDTLSAFLSVLSYRCLEIVSDVQISYQMFRDHLRCSEIISDVQRSSQMFRDYLWCSEIISDVQRSSQMFRDHLRCSEIISDVQRSS